MYRKLMQLLTFKKMLFIGVLLSLMLLLRWNSFSTPFERDEGEYAYSAWILRQGIMPYENSFLQKPPMIVYTYAFGQIFDPVGIVSPRVLSAIFSFFTVILVALIAKKELGRKAAYVSAFLLVPMLVLPYNAAFAANTEHFMLLPLMGVIAIFFYKRGQEKLIDFFWAGVLSALSILYKPFPVYLLIFLFSVWFFKKYKKEKRISQVVMGVLMVALGGVLTTVLVLSPFIVKGNLSYLIESALIYNRYYIEFIGYSPQAFITHNIKIFRVYWPFLLLLIFYLAKRPKNWWLYLGFLGISTASIYQSWINHYYIFIMPFMALIASYSIVLIGSLKTIKKNIKSHFETIITIVILIMIILPFRQQFGKTPEELSLYIYGTVNPFYEAPLVARKLAEVTKPVDKVFIAGSEPEILFYAKRKSPTRFVITYPLNITTRIRGDYQKEAVASLSKDPPEAIVYSTRYHSGLWNEGSPRVFIDYLEGVLKKDYIVTGAFIWGPNRGFWLDRPQRSDLETASLILYVKK